MTTLQQHVDNYETARARAIEFLSKCNHPHLVKQVAHAYGVIEHSYHAAVAAAAYAAEVECDGPDDMDELWEILVESPLNDGSPYENWFTEEVWPAVERYVLCMEMIMGEDHAYPSN